MTLVFCRPSRWLGFLFVFFASVLAAQDVISVRSGFLLHTEGKVWLDGEAIQPDSTKKLHVEPGKRLRTEDGRAEMMLALGTLLRLGKNSELEMVEAGMTSGQARIVQGAAVVDAARVFDPDSISLLAADKKISFPTDGYYRLDAGPQQPVTLKVYKGKAVVSSGDSKVKVKSKKAITLAEAPAEWTVTKFNRKETDALENWSKARTKAIEQTNRTLMARGEGDAGDKRREQEMLRFWLEAQRQRTMTPRGGYGGSRGGASGGGASSSSGGSRGSPGRSRGR